jgi:hypothetical protein
MLEFYTENVCGTCGKRLPLTIISVYGEVYCGGGIDAETQLREFLEQLCVSSPLVLSSTLAESATVNPDKLTTLIEAELQRLMMEDCEHAPSASHLGPQRSSAFSPMMKGALLKHTRKLGEENEEKPEESEA